jgi:hypothetical protein
MEKENNWKEKYEKEHKLRQEAETETILVKGIGMNSPEMKAANNEINNLKNKIAELTDSLNSKDYFKDPDYKYLIDENRRLEQERNELLTEKKKMIQITEDRIKQARKAGL